MLEPRTVSTAYVRAALSAAQAAGIDQCLVLQGLPIDAQTLLSPNDRVSVALARSIWERAVVLSKDPLLGLKAGQEMKPGTFRILGLAAMSAASLDEAVGLMLRFQRLVSESGTLSGHRLPDGAIALMHTEQSRVPLLPQQVEAVFAALLYQARWLSGRALTPTALAFRHAALGPVEPYIACFGLTPRFGQAASQLTFSAADLQAPLPYADPDLYRMHCDLAEKQLAALPTVGFVSSFAIQWIDSRSSGRTRIGDLASALGMSTRSLQRSLRSEGHSWTSVIDGARRAQLQALLRQGASLADAAQRLGYHDAASVSRAARRWFGTSAGRWRRNDGLAP